MRCFDSSNEAQQKLGSETDTVWLFLYVCKQVLVIILYLLMCQSWETYVCNKDISVCIFRKNLVTARELENFSSDNFIC